MTILLDSQSYSDLNLTLFPLSLLASDLSDHEFWRNYNES